MLRNAARRLLNASGIVRFCICEAEWSSVNVSSKGNDTSRRTALLWMRPCWCCPIIGRDQWPCHTAAKGRLCGYTHTDNTHTYLYGYLFEKIQVSNPKSYPDANHNLYPALLPISFRKTYTLKLSVNPLTAFKLFSQASFGISISLFLTHRLGRTFFSCGIRQLSVNGQRLGVVNAEKHKC